MDTGPDSCWSCHAVEREPSSGLYTIGCERCSIRRLARSPGFAASMAAHKLRSDYLAAIRQIGGENWLDMHKRVRIEYERLLGAGAC